MLEVKLAFPSVMKMDYRTRIEIPEETPLDQLRQTIFNIIWQPLTEWHPDVEGHGQEGLSFQARNVTIETDEDLHDRILEGCTLHVVFSGHRRRKLSEKSEDDAISHIH